MALRIGCACGRETVLGVSRRLLAAVPWCQSNQRAHHTSGTSLKYIPRRAVLYVPGNDERKLQKLTSLNVDCAVLDCEDGVALNMKNTKEDILKNVGN